jgi:manganese-dependent inorganic pyrophosphatase
MARNTIYVIGHKNPDTDAIISAMAYAYLKQQLGFDAIAVRAGAVNAETEYILNEFNEFAPPLTSSIRTCVRDIDFDDVVTCRPQDNFKTALKIMNDNHKKVIAVTDDHRHLLGVATVSDMTKPIVIDQPLKERLLQQVTPQQLAVVLQATIHHDGGNRSNGKVYVASYYNMDFRDKIVVVSNNPAKQREVIKGGAAVVIICGSGCQPEVIEAARQTDTTVMVTALDIYEATREIDLAIPVSLVMTTGLTVFRYDDLIDDVKQKIIKSRYRSYPILDARDHVVGMLSRYHIFKHASRNVILVDHNELSQAVDGAEEANIMEIIDHHRIGGIKTGGPVVFRNEPVGCCSTIITEMFEEKGVEIPEDLAGMLCCAIISDTMNFKSVTCTEKDRATARKLAGIAGLDLEDIARRILEAGASLANRSVADIFTHDLKYYTINRRRVAVGQNNVVNFESFAALRDKMNAHLGQFSQSNAIDICMMVFSLIDGSGSYVLVQGPEAAKAMEGFADIAVNVDGFTFLPKIMSRKLEIIPTVTEALE